MKELREENHELREQLRIQSLLVNKFEQEVRQLRQVAFLDEQFEGERNIDSTIMAVLRRGPTHDYKLLEILDVDPKDADQVRAVYKQLEILELHGLITKDRRGWRWLGK
jgi:DNA-directed RNA polymerase subunit F